MTHPLRHAAAPALAAALALQPSPLRAGIPVFDGLNWVENALTKVEAWVQTAQSIAQGDWASAAMYGSTSVTSLDSLGRVRTTLGRGLSARHRLERAYRNVNALRDLRSGVTLGAAELYGGATDIEMWAIGENWDWGERQHRTKLDEVWTRVLTKGRSAIDRSAQGARERLARVMRDDPCGDGTLSCPDGARVRNLLRAQVVLDLATVQRRLCEDSARLSELDREAAAADDTATPEAGAGAPGDATVPGSDDPAPGSTDGSSSSEATKQANYQLSTGGLQAQVLRLQQRREQARITELRGSVLREDCRSRISDEEVAALSERIRELEAAHAEAGVARATMQAMVVTRARMNCQGRGLANLHRIAYGTAGDPADYDTCVQERLDEIWDEALAHWSSDPANAGLAAPAKPAVN